MLIDLMNVDATTLRLLLWSLWCTNWNERNTCIIWNSIWFQNMFVFSILSHSNVSKIIRMQILLIKNLIELIPMLQIIFIGNSCSNLINPANRIHRTNSCYSKCKLLSRFTKNSNKKPRILLWNRSSAFITDCLTFCVCGHIKKAERFNN